MFNSNYTAAANAIVKYTTPKVVYIQNPTDGVIKILKRYPISKIGEFYESGYFVTTLTKAFTALTVALALIAGAGMALANAIDAVNPISLAIPSIGAEFDLPILEETLDLPDKLYMPEKHSILGLKMIEDLPEILTKDGAYIYTSDLQLAKRFTQINKGLIKVLKEDLMQVLLVEGWQHQMYKARMYPLSYRDYEVLDQIFGMLYDQGKLKWAIKPTPFVYPVFVVWRTFRGK
ncbi:hypothetical protein MMYC01_210343 [Madurella mycetomatis]|uniref:Uncharacterized protein n=1 Tax=Madurella mycetomatis TaxID=100816 RepID=A0A175VPC7_9PEZI|nr:hypothetical protein MMYC01_210343 [Madurella mycetomatis]